MSAVVLLERDRELAAVDDVLLRGGVLTIEGGAGIGKTALLDEACHRAERLGHEVLRARGSELEAGFALGAVRQLFERRLVGADAGEREELLCGPAAAARPLFSEPSADDLAGDSSFAVLHGLYWLAANLAVRRPLLIAVDDAHWADAPSLRWLAYLAPRVQGLALALVAALRPAEPASDGPALLLLRREAAAVVRPELLSREAVAAIVRGALGDAADDEIGEALARASGGNPFYLRELLRTLDREGLPERLDPAALIARGGGGVVQEVAARIRRLDPQALGVARALAVLGDGCELRHAAAIAGVDVETAQRWAAALVRLEVLATDAPPRFLHPILREAVDASLGRDERDAAHRAAARLLAADRASPGRVAAHLLRVRPAGDGWAVEALRRAARAAMESGAPVAAAELLDRALAEPPLQGDRLDVLREAARADAAAGRGAAFQRLEEAMAEAATPRERGEIALEVAEAHAALFRWVEAVDAIERALAELGDQEPQLAARLEGQLVVAGLHDAQRASRVPPVLARLAARTVAGSASEALAVAGGMAAVLAGGRAEEAARPLETALARAAPEAENWDTRAALLWSLVVAERFAAVDAALGPMLEAVHRTGSARGFVATYSTLGLLRLRLGALPEADAASRVALRVLQEGDFAPGLAFAATVLADVAVEAGELEEAEALIALLPQEGWPAGLATVLIPASRGRLRLAQGRAAEALADFGRCGEMFSPAVWGTEMRDVGYLHARSGAALALLQLGQRDAAAALVDAELADVRAFGGARAMGVALRVAGLARGGEEGLGLLAESAGVLSESPALLERARSLADLGAALRRAGRRADAREPLAEALDLAVRCGARPLAARAREELTATGARPRRGWRRGVEALTPSELRIARLAAAGQTNREIAHELYVTLKTVEGHLAHAYGKLGIAGRGELPGALGEEKTRVPTLSRAAPGVGDGSAARSPEPGGPR